ncbi:DUF4153 domain-containing protein [Flavobacterium sp.]|uniref:DUF4153 domain-containing protein n=1 Tax=Flavobacterium sp. TaxID=239 RepID=UPI0037BF1C52
MIEKVKALFLNYPFVLIMSLAFVITVIYGIEFEPKKEDGFLLIKLGLTFSLGISMQFALKILSQRVKKGIIWQLLGLLFLILYFFILPKEEKDFSEFHLFIILPSYVLSHLLVAFVAFLKEENSELSFWEYNKNLFVNLFLTVVFTGVLIGGVELAIVAVQELFNIDFEAKIYAETFFALAIFGSTFIFLLFNESGLDYLEKEGKYPVILKFFTQFILIPLLIIYVVILYFYSAKILINWQLPRGWVSYLVLAYSIVGIFALLLVHPLKDLKLKSWILVFNKLFYYTLIPLILLLFVAIFTRVLQYGYTEARYFVLLISIWLTTIVLYFIFVKKSSIKFIPTSLFFFGLFSLLMPYLNAFSVSKRSQEHELIEILKSNQLLVNNKIDFDKPISDSIANSVEDKLEFLSKRFDDDFINAYLNKENISKTKTDKYWYSNQFTNISYTNNSKRKNIYLTITANNHLKNVQNFDFVILPNSYSDYVETKIKNDKITITNRNKSEFEIKVNDESKDILPLIKKICNKYKNAAKDVSVQDLSIKVSFDKYEITAVFNSIEWYEEYNTYSYGDIIYLIKTKS